MSRDAKPCFLAQTYGLAERLNAIWCQMILINLNFYTNYLIWILLSKLHNAVPINMIWIFILHTTQTYLTACSDKDICLYIH